MQLAGSRFFSYNLYPLEILQSSVVPELLFVLPIFGPGLDVLNFFDLVVDVTCVGNKRIFTIEGQRWVEFILIFVWAIRMTMRRVLCLTGLPCWVVTRRWCWRPTWLHATV